MQNALHDFWVAGNAPNDAPESARMRIPVTRLIRAYLLEE